MPSEQQQGEPELTPCRSRWLWQVLATTFVQSFQAPVAPAAPARANMQMALECATPSATLWVLTLCQRVGADPLVPPVCRQLPGAGPETGGKPWDPMGISDMCPYGSSQYEWMRTAEVGAAAAL